MKEKKPYQFKMRLANNIIITAQQEVHEHPSNLFALRCGNSINRLSKQNRRRTNGNNLLVHDFLFPSSIRCLINLLLPALFLSSSSSPLSCYFMRFNFVPNSIRFIRFGIGIGIGFGVRLAHLAVTSTPKILSVWLHNETNMYIHDSFRRQIIQIRIQNWLIRKIMISRLTERGYSL